MPAPPPARRPLPPLPLRKERAWNVFDRNLKKHPIISKLLRNMRYALQWQVVRRDRGSHDGGYNMVQTAGGGETFGLGSDYTDLNENVPCIEQQGIASQLGAGARGLVAPNMGGVSGSAVAIGLRKLSHRPKVLQPWDVCLYNVAGTRAWLKDNGELRLETGLADYKETPDDLDEGAKLRLHLGGEVGRAELYGQDFVRARAQAAGGEGASAQVLLEVSGAVTLQANDGSGTVATIELLDGNINIYNTSGASATITPDGNIVLTPADGKKVLLGGDDATLAATRQTDPVNPGVPFGVWAGIVEAVINGLAPGTFTPANNFAATVATPANSGNFGAVGTGSAVVKIK